MIVDVEVVLGFATGAGGMWRWRHDGVGVKVGVDKRHNPQPLVKRGSKKK